MFFNKRKEDVGKRKKKKTTFQEFWAEDGHDLVIVKVPFTQRVYQFPLFIHLLSTSKSTLKF